MTESHTGMGIYGAWAAGNLFSLVVLASFVAIKKRWRSKRYLPQWNLLRKMGGAAMQHHLLNLVLSAPNLILPVMVTVILSAQANAWFYVAWMVANFVFMVPGSLTIVLHAVNSAQQATLRQRARVTLTLAFAVSLIAICVIILGTKQVLSLFGRAYAEEASLTLQILALGALPIIIKNHYVSICRIYDRTAQALIGIASGSLLELGTAGFGGHIGGLVGLSGGWVIAMSIESIFMLPTIYKTVFSAQSSKQQAGVEPAWLMDTALLPAMGRGYMGVEPVWIMNTAPLPAMGRGYTVVEPIWLMNTILLPVVKLPARKKES